jgi:hypothetical protein
VEPRPPVIQPSEPIDAATWESTILTGTEYDHRAVLVEDETYFLWSVDGDEIKAKMVHKGFVGWMSIGAESIGGGHNGMNGAHIVMGLNDLEDGMHVGEYRIHPFASAFRNWKTPLSPTALSSSTMTVADGVSVMQFRTKSMHGVNLNITQGTNRLIWGLTHNAYSTNDFGGYAAYHASETSDRSQRTRFRGKVELNLQTGKQLFDTPHGSHPDHASEEAHTEESGDHDNPESEAHAESASTASPMTSSAPSDSDTDTKSVESSHATALHVLAALMITFAVADAAPL